MFKLICVYIQFIYAYDLCMFLFIYICENVDPSLTKSQDGSNKFWLRNNRSIPMLVDDYEWYRSQAGIVAIEITLVETKHAFKDV